VIITASTNRFRAAALLVFLVWYPRPYASIAGGLSLFGLLLGVDVITGPALAAVAASPSKSAGEFGRDLTFIVCIQLAAFGYGLYTIALARPVHLAFEVDRMRVGTAADTESSFLVEALPKLRLPSWSGPDLIVALRPSDPAEQTRTIEPGATRIDLSMMPRYRAEYDEHRDKVWLAARPIAQLRASTSIGPALDELMHRMGRSPEALRFLPLVPRHASWDTVLAAPNANMIGDLPCDGFF